jgi:hypothetical protein
MLAAMTNNAAVTSDFKMSRQRPYFILVLLKNVPGLRHLQFQTMKYVKVAQ